MSVPLIARTEEALSAVLSPALASDALALLEPACVGYLASQAKLFATLRTLEPLVSAPPASTTDAHTLSDALVECARAMKQMELHRRERLLPLEGETKAINAVYRAFTGPIETWVARGKKSLGAWQQADRARVAREQEEHRRKQEAAARAEAEALAQADAARTPKGRAAALAQAEAASQEQALATVTAPLEATRAWKGETGSAGVRERWVFQVRDAALVPRSFCIPDEKAIRAAVNAGVREIPGVAIYTEESVAVRVR